MFGLTLNRIQLNDLASSAIILLLLGFVFYTTQLFSRIDNLIFDIGQRIVKTSPPDDVIIIAIDQDSLSQIGRWPWSRKVHAELLQHLKTEQAAAIGFDVIFAEPEKTNPLADKALAIAIADARNVVLPVLLESVRANGQIVETLPLPDFVAHAADIGRVHTELDEDSIARSVYLHEGLGGPVWQLFAQAILNTAHKKMTLNHFDAIDETTNYNPYTLVKSEHRRINYLGPPGHFKQISFAQVLQGNYEKGLFRNKIVLVGATALGMNDLLTTPVSGLGLPMAGVEFHANVLESIRSNKLIKSVPDGFALVVVLVICVLPLLWMPKMSALMGFLSSILFLVLIAFLSIILPKIWNVWLPPAAALVSLLLAYPIWSWRKLEAAQRFLDYELVYLKQNLISLPTAKSDFSQDVYDKFDARIAQVRTASQQLRYLNEDRKETLAFISHDLRAPIAGALLVVDQHQELKKRLNKPLSQALKLAEDFLQASRAEMMDVANFTDIDFSGLVHQAIDDAYDNATQKKMTLVRNISLDIVWIKGNFGLMHRAVLNLILNAIKYGPENSKVVVDVSLNAENTHVVISVTDVGPGIPKNEQENLFKRFSRVKGHEKLAEGAGLGLYFVRTVTEKHQGLIDLVSDLGSPTTFRLHLPVVD